MGTWQMFVKHMPIWPWFIVVVIWQSLEKNTLQVTICIVWWWKNNWHNLATRFFEEEEESSSSINGDPPLTTQSSCAFYLIMIIVLVRSNHVIVFPIFYDWEFDSLHTPCLLPQQFINPNHLLMVRLVIIFFFSLGEKNSCFIYIYIYI